jgi:hypothetical protein
MKLEKKTRGPVSYAYICATHAVGNNVITRAISKSRDKFSKTLCKGTKRTKRTIFFSRQRKACEMNFKVKTLTIPTGCG